MTQQDLNFDESWTASTPKFNWYFKGQRLTDALLNRGTLSHRHQSEMLARLICGEGILDGLRVDIDNGTIKVSPGAAVDRLGQLVIVPLELSLDLLQLARSRFPNPESDIAADIYVKLDYQSIKDDHLPQHKHEITGYRTEGELDVEWLKWEPIQPPDSTAASYVEFTEQTAKLRREPPKHAGVFIGRFHLILEKGTYRLESKIDQSPQQTSQSPRNLSTLAELHRYLSSFGRKLTIEIVEGNGQTVAVHSPTKPIKLKVLNRDGHGVDGIILTVHSKSPSIKLRRQGDSNWTPTSLSLPTDKDGGVALECQLETRGLCCIDVELTGPNEASSDYATPLVITAVCEEGLAIAHGNHQRGLIYSALSERLEVRLHPSLDLSTVREVRFEDDRRIDFKLHSLPHKIESHLVSTTWTMSVPGINFVKAKLFLRGVEEAVSEVTFLLSAETSIISVSHGLFQKGDQFKALDDQIVVKVSRPDGTPVPRALIRVRGCEHFDWGEFTALPPTVKRELDSNCTCVESDSAGTGSISWVPQRPGLNVLHLTHVIPTGSEILQLSSNEVHVFARCDTVVSPPSSTEQTGN